jgi:hypothetical protein
MFRRVAAAVPSQAGRVLSTVVRPNIASPVRTAVPTLASAGRRQYHEKDMFIPLRHEIYEGRVAMTSARSDPTLSSLQHASAERSANTHSTA